MGISTDNADRGPVNRRKALAKYCTEAVQAYRSAPEVHQSDYLFALLTAARVTDTGYDEAVHEYKAQLDKFIKDMDAASLEERIRRVWAFSELRNHTPVNDYEQWLGHREALKHIDPSHLDDETFLLWCEATKIWPENELLRRSEDSCRVRVEYLRRLAAAAIKEESRDTERKKLEKNLHNLNDELIGDLIGMKIDAQMPWSTLNALTAVFFMRLQLAQVAGEENERIYESLCRLRFEEIAEALTRKYPTSSDLNERIAVLESIETISQIVNYEHSEMALAETMKLSGLPELSDYQRFSLENIFRQDYSECDKTIDALLPQTRNAYDMKALLDIEELGTEPQRQAVMDKYTELFSKALAEENASELAALLSAAAYRNTNPQWRPLLTDLTSRAATLPNIPAPEKRINLIAAEIFTRIDTITGK